MTIKEAWVGNRPPQAATAFILGKIEQDIKRKLPEGMIKAKYYELKRGMFARYKGIQRI